MGIWNCRKCNAKFTGKAYSISKKIITKEAEELVEESETAKLGALESEEASEEA